MFYFLSFQNVFSLFLYFMNLSGINNAVKMNKEPKHGPTLYVLRSVPQ